MKYGLIGFLLGALALFLLLRFSSCDNLKGKVVPIESDTIRTLVFQPIEVVSDPVEVIPDGSPSVTSLLWEIDSLIELNTFTRHEGYRYRNERNRLRGIIEELSRNGNCNEALVKATSEIDNLQSQLEEMAIESEHIEQEAQEIRSRLGVLYENVHNDTTDNYILKASIVTQGFELPENGFRYRVHTYQNTVTNTAVATDYLSRKHSATLLGGQNRYAVQYSRRLFGRLSLAGQIQSNKSLDFDALGGIRFEW